MGSTRPNPTHVGCIGLGWTSMMGWVWLNFFLTYHGGLGQKILSTQPTMVMPTYLHLKLNTTIRLFFKILDYEISFQDCKFFVFLLFVKLAYPMGYL